MTTQQKNKIEQFLPSLDKIRQIPGYENAFWSLKTNNPPATGCTLGIYREIPYLPGAVSGYLPKTTTDCLYSVHIEHIMTATELNGNGKFVLASFWFLHGFGLV